MSSTRFPRHTAADQTEERGSSEERAEEIATRTVNKDRAQAGESRRAPTMLDPELGLTSRAPGVPTVTKLDELQAELGEGPCVQAAAVDSTETVLIDDIGQETRWPRFTAAAQTHGIGSVLPPSRSTARTASPTCNAPSPAAT